MQQLTRSGACVSDLVLDEWLAGELDAAASEHVVDHVARCERCTARRSERERDREAFLGQAPSFTAHGALISGAARPTRARTRARTGWLAGAGALALAAGALLLLRTPEDPGTRSKGAAYVGFFVKRGEHVTRGVRGQTVHPGDALRFTYTSVRDAHLALVNVDAHAASVYYPDAAHAAARVRAGSDVPLDFSVELDARLGTERVYALFCAQAFAVEPVRAALQLGAGRSRRYPTRTARST